MKTRYVATQELTYPVDATWVDRLLSAAAQGPDAAAAARAEAHAADVFKTVQAGEDCSDVPTCSVSWLLDQGQIKALPAPVETDAPTEASSEDVKKTPRRRSKKGTDHE